MRRVLAGTALVAALVVAGCGDGSAPSNGEASKPARQVLADAARAAKDATSFHVSGHGHFQDNGAPFSFDMTLVKGKGGTSSLPGPQKVDAVVIGPDAYIKAGADFWENGVELGAALVRKYQDTWVKVPPSDSRFIDYVNFADTQPLFDALTSGRGTVTNKGATTYDGQRVVEIDGAVDTDGSKIGTLYIAATGTAYPVAIVAKGALGGVVTFDSWNKPVTLTPPPGAIDFGHS